MRYKLHSLLWIFLVCAAMGILAFNIPMAKAADIEQLTLELPTITDALPVPGTELDVPVTVVDGYTDADEVITISIHIEYDSEVVRPRGTSSDDIIVDFDTFGITGWTVTSNITEDPGTLPNSEQLRIVMNSPTDPIIPLSEPIGDFPADLLTIKFEVQTFDETDSTPLLFLRDETGFRKGVGDLDRLILDGDTVDGNISFEPSPSEKITLDLASTVIHINQGETEGMVPLTIMGGYLDRDLVDIVFLTIQYDSTVVEVVNPSTDVVIDDTTFGISLGQWVATSTKIGAMPDVHWLQIDLHNADPLNNPALSEPTGGFPADLLTINFTAVSFDPTDETCLLLVDSSRSYFQKRDGTKLPIDGINNPCPQDPHGDIGLPVKNSALGAISHLNNGIKIFWEAESQQGNLGWNIYRSETKDGKYVKINGELIKGAGTTANPMKYSFIDKDAEKGTVYYYYLEDISFNGEKHRTDRIKSIPVNKNGSWGDIKRSALR